MAATHPPEGTMTRIILILVALSLSAAPLAACGKGDLTKAASKTEEAVDNAGDKLNEAGRNVGEGLKKAGEEIDRELSE